MPLKKPELLCPAGSFEKMRYAFAYGADAVYAGLPIFSLRARENDFNLEEVKKGLDYARERNKKVYLTANIFARNTKIKPFIKSLDEFAALKPDALIMSDPGLISIVKERHPEIPIHLSVQANCMNWASVKFWHQVGIERIILSRELRLNEVKTIKDQVPEMELEAFVHGSLCIAYSGRCLLSHYMSRRDANQGHCDNSCRYPVNVYKADANEEQGEYYIEELRDKGQFYRLDEDEHGTYVMNSKDLCLIQYLDQIIKAGVDSLKVEGRTKSLHYVSVVSRAYRQAIDDWAEGKEFDENLLKELAPLSSRGYTPGFMISGPQTKHQIYQPDFQPPKTGFMGVVTEGEGRFQGMIPVHVRGQLRTNQRYQLYTPDGVQEFTLGNMKDEKGNSLDVAHPGIGTIEAEIPLQVPPYALVRELS